MMLLPTNAITISPTRQRLEFNDVDLQELAASIAARGLLHAVVVRKLPTGFQLVAGERRIRAINTLHFLNKPVFYGLDAGGERLRVPADQIPCLDVGELSDLDAEEAELDENIKRKDLTWQERANATDRLATLRGKQAAAAGAEAPKVASIALEVRGSAAGIHHETTRRELIVAKHLADPEVQAAKSVDEAFKVLRRKEQAANHVQLAARVGLTYTSDIHQVHNVESFAWMEAFTGELFDVVCTDPIYGIGADTFGDSGGIAAGGAHKYVDSYAQWKADMPKFARLAARLTKPQAHLYAFCDIDRFVEFKQILTDEGWNCFRSPIIWHKPAGSRLPWVDFGPQRKYELVLYANKGRKPVTRIFPDLVSYPADENLGWAAQKPVGIYLDLLKRSCAPGDRILDPFAGSGPVFPAANELRCAAIGLEVDPVPYGICLRRLEALKAQKELPLAASLLGELKS